MHTKFKETGEAEIPYKRMITYTGYNRSWHGSLSDRARHAHEIQGNRRGRDIADLYRFLMCRQGGGGEGIGGFKWLADFKGGSFTARR